MNIKVTVIIIIAKYCTLSCETIMLPSGIMYFSINLFAWITVRGMIFIFNNTHIARKRNTIVLTQLIKCDPFRNVFLLNMQHNSNQQMFASRLV